MLRHARVDDVEPIRQLIEGNLDKLLPRNSEELHELINWFWVVEQEGEIVGCCCLEIYSPKIAELRSLAVRGDCRGKGYGEQLVNAVVEEVKHHSIKQLLVVTSTPEFFENLNFGQCLNEKYALFWSGKTAQPHQSAAVASEVHKY
ncbi:MAG: GNAT family N-acetyltransferase [Chloroflexota bacterium]